MNRLASYFTALLLAASVTVVAAEAGTAQRFGAGGGRRAPRPAAVPTFTVSGDFSGTLAGTIELEGVTYQLAPDAPMFELGRGAVAQGTYFNYRRICLSGIQTSAGMLVQSVIVRPARNMALAGTDPSVFIHVRGLNEDRPR